MYKSCTIQKKTILVLGMIIFLLYPNVVRGDQWVMYSGIGGKSYYDKDSITKTSESTVTVWTQVFPSQEWIDLRRKMLIEHDKMLKEEGRKDPFKKRKVDDDVVYKLKSLIEINCEEGSYRHLKMMLFNKSGQIIWSKRYNRKSIASEGIRRFEPNTMGYYFYDDVCSEEIKR